ncbi:MAG TPA: family 10 glycosylhydrolase [Flavisolibacter sp.]|jgi:uncharacterized lipoprotein YddW (UPF0748 family)
MTRLLLLALSLFTIINVQAQEPPLKREFRGAWIATFANIDWPNRTQTPQQQRQAFIDILNHHKATGINALFVQVRSQCDAMYPSTIEPWSADLTGVQGRAPNPLWDPMQFMIDECHKRGIEFHAWINPYRAASNSANIPNFAANHVTKTHPEWLLSQGILRVLDPGIPAVRDHITSVVVDILERYDVDGIHFDDYFYPAPQSGVTPFNDDASYNADPRGILNRGEWRRDNVNIFIQRIYDTVKAVKPWVKFGVSPTGIWRNRSSDPVNGSATSGLEHYSAVYADSRKWLQQGWIDYLVPQLYWYIGQPGSNYGVLAPWWNGNANSRHVYLGMAGYKVNDPAQGANWANPSQIPNQVRLNRTLSNIFGQAVYNTSSMRTNRLGFRDSLRLRFYNRPALLPNMPWRDDTPPEAPSALAGTRFEDDSVVLNWTAPSATGELDKAIRFVIYRSASPVIDITDPNNILAITDTASTRYIDRSLQPGVTTYYTVTSVDRFHNESAPSNVTDYEPPVINCNAVDAKLTPNSSCTAILPDYRSQVTVSDDVTPASAITVTQLPAPGTVLQGPAGMEVQLTATDASGKSSVCNVWVYFEDVTAPVILPLNSSITDGGTITLPADAGQCTFKAGTGLDVQATDNCDTLPVLSYTLTYNGITSEPVDARSLEGVVFQKGTTIVSWTASDWVNTSTFSYSVVVEDQEAPVITGATADPSVLFPPNHKMRNVNLSYTVADNCGPVTTEISVSSNEPVTGTGNGDVGPDWEIIDNHRLKLRAERSGSGSGRIYTITITSTDGSGNQGVQTVVVTVPHDRGNITSANGGINEEQPIQQGFTVNATPNPSSGRFTLVTQSSSTETLSIRVLDNSGRQVETRSGISANGTLHLGSHYRPGVYHVEIRQGKEVRSIRLVKQ